MSKILEVTIGNKSMRINLISLQKYQKYQEYRIKHKEKTLNYRELNKAIRLLISLPYRTIEFPYRQFYFLPRLRAN